jgi:RNA polymerase sigma-70 factor (ECF subfamily)
LPLRDDVSATQSKVLPADAAPGRTSSQTIEELVSLHYRFVWRVLRGFGLSPSDAQDAAQQVFMIAMRKLDSIDPSRERSFVYGTAMHVANNARRSQRRRREAPEDDDTEAVAPSNRSPEHQTELAEARVLLADILAQLPEKFRRVLVLAEIEQLEVPEIASLEGVPVGTAASRLRLARQQFRNLLEAAQDRNPFTGAT